MDHRLTIGLTGGIGSGKSTVAARLSNLGAVVVDTDAIARALTAVGGAAIPALREAFGDEAIGVDGAFDRDRMRRLVFADADAKRRLEALLHPLIGREAERQASAAPDRPVVFDVPLLAESARWRRRVRRVLVVDCSEATQARRVVERSGWDEATVRRVIAQQAPRAARRAIADAVVHNDGLTLDGLRAQVRALWAHWQRASAAG
jgi:dephospho-CoA kinase